MGTITDSDLGDDYWATTEQVQDRIRMEIQNSDPDWDTEINEATDDIQARWEDATGKTDSDYPDPVPKLLQYATAYLAASEAHLHFAANVSGENNGDEKHVFLEQKARQKFEKWRAKADLQAGSDTESSPSTVAGEKGSLTDDIL